MVHSNPISHNFNPQATEKLDDCLLAPFSNNPMSQLFNALPMGIFWLDTCGLVKYVNTAAYQIFSAAKTSCAKDKLNSGDQLIGKTWRSIIADYIQPESQQTDEIQLKNGKYIDVATQAVPSIDSETSLEQLIIVSDQTSTLAYQASKARTERLKELGTMSATLAHQLRTPLSTALIYANQLHDYELTPTRQKIISQRMLDQLKYMNRQMNDLLFFVKGDLQLSDEVSLNELLTLVRATLESQLDGRQLIFKARNIGLEHSFLCHRDSLAGALVNLVTNSLQASPIDAPVSIRIHVIHSETHNSMPGHLAPSHLAPKYNRADNSHRNAFNALSLEAPFGQYSDKPINQLLCFDVVDQGLGFNLQVAQHLAQHGQSNKADSNGFGLKFAQVVAERHGGKLSLIPFQGTCVRLSIKMHSLIENPKLHQQINSIQLNSFQQHSLNQQASAKESEL